MSYINIKVLLLIIIRLRFTDVDILQKAYSHYMSIVHVPRFVFNVLMKRDWPMILLSTKVCFFNVLMT